MVHSLILTTSFAFLLFLGRLLLEGWVVAPLQTELGLHRGETVRSGNIAKGKSTQGLEAREGSKG